MSIYWGYVCQSHDPEMYSGRLINWGAERLREIYADRKALTAKQDENYGGGLFNTDADQPIHWLRDHPRCVVALRSEYGETEPLGAVDTTPAEPAETT